MDLENMTRPGARQDDSIKLQLKPMQAVQSYSFLYPGAGSSVQEIQFRHKP